MNLWNRLNKKVASPLVLLAVAILVAVVTAEITARKTVPDAAIATPDPAELYRRAILDAMTVEADEILPLIAIASDAPLCTWKDGKVLLLTWHRYPDSYVPGAEYTLKYGEVWTFTDKEIVNRFREEKKRGVTDWDSRFRQLIGVSPEKKYTHFSAMWTKPEDILRPGYAWRLSDTIGADGFAEEPDSAYKTWFDGNIVWSYFDSAYPWTRLGYTYDWGEGESEYGLSEFLIRKDAAVEVEFTLTTEEFVRWLERQ